MGDGLGDDETTGRGVKKLRSVIPTKIWSVEELLGERSARPAVPNDRLVDVTKQNATRSRPPHHTNRVRVIDSGSGTKLYHPLLAAEEAETKANRGLRTQPYGDSLELDEGHGDARLENVSTLLFERQLEAQHVVVTQVTVAPPSPPGFDAVRVAQDSISPEPTRDPAKQRRVGDYEVLERLRRYDNGTEYLCRHAGDRAARFTLKVLRAQLPDGVGADSFARTARRVAQLTHRNVLRLVEAGVHRRQPYFVRQRCFGSTLADVLADCPVGDRPLPVLLRVFGDAVESIVAAHDATLADGGSACLVHGALSTDQVLISSDGRTLINGMGECEAVLIRPPAATADVVALGEILYELLTGVRPTLTEDGKTLIPATQLDPDLPPDLGTLCEQVLAPDPDITEARHLLHRLREIVSSKGLEASLEDVGDWAGPMLRRDRVRQQLPPGRHSFPSLAITEDTPQPKGLLDRVQETVRHWFKAFA